jgi:hypothetical protein
MRAGMASQSTPGSGFVEAKEEGGRLIAGRIRQFSAAMIARMVILSAAPGAAWLPAKSGRDRMEDLQGVADPRIARPAFRSHPAAWKIGLTQSAAGCTGPPPPGKK